MAKPIKDLPILKGKDAREFEKRFLKDVQPDPKKDAMNKKAIDIYRTAKVI